jgi:hypothetical protein
MVRDNTLAEGIAATVALAKYPNVSVSYAKASYRQRITHFTEELSFLSEADKDWVMGRAISQRLRWT